MGEPVQGSLFPEEGIDHTRRLHEGGGGFVIVASKTEGWREWAVSTRQLEPFLRDFPHRIDAYITQNRFAGKHRRIAGLLEADALWADIDFYKHPELAGMHPLSVRDEILFELERKRIPEPSVTISSGRGVYVMWLHSPIPISELARWNDCQSYLHSILKGIGSDPASRDAARVLRIPGTTNSKSGSRVEVLSSTDEVWEFDDLFFEIMGEAQRAPRKGKVHDLTTEAFRKGRGSGYFALNRWSPATLWALRYEELRKLREFRWPNGIPPGDRNNFLFISSVALSWITSPANMRRELSHLTRLCRGDWTEKHSEWSVQATLKRVLKAARGETVTYNGLEIDPRYRFKSESIVELLEISEKEMRTLGFRNLVSQVYSKEIRATRKALSRATNPHTKGHLSHTDYEYKNRNEYEANSENRNRPWDSMGISRTTYYRMKAKGLNPE